MGSVPPDEAERLISHGAVVCDRRGATVCAIRLARQIEAPIRPPSPPSVTQYMGQRYTYRQSLDGGNGQVARCFDFKHIAQGDRDLFCLSVTDNLGPRRDKRDGLG